MDELATLAFYVYVGYAFRPQENSPYFKVDAEDIELEVKGGIEKSQKGSGTLME